LECKPKLIEGSGILDSATLEASQLQLTNSILELKNIMASLIGGGIPVVFPSAINANITNTNLPISGNVGIIGTVSTVTADKLVLLEKEYDVTTASQAIPLLDFPANCTGIIYQYLSSNVTELLYSRMDGQSVTFANGGKTRPEVGPQIDGLTVAKAFRYLGTSALAKGLKVYFLG
jgi:hypothetical protein